MMHRGAQPKLIAPNPAASTISSAIAADCGKVASMDEPTSFLGKGLGQAQSIRAYDWSSTSLGPIENWPSALKAVVGMMLGSAFPKCVAWGPDLIMLYNDAFRPILGEKPEALGRPFSEVWIEAWDEIGPIAERALAGEATFIEDFPLEVLRHGFPEQAYFTFCYSPLRDERGNILGFLDTVIETTRRVETELQSTILNRELAHRMRNLMTVVSALVSQTLKSANTIEAAQTALSQRLTALGGAQDLLTSAARSDAPIHKVLQAALELHDVSDKVTLNGPLLHLDERQAQAMALAANELATNALKYGALSNTDGRIAVTWSLKPGGAFMFNWEEQNGPPVETPSRRGFGSLLIETHVGQAFRGEAGMEFRQQGLLYTITSPSLATI